LTTERGGGPGLLLTRTDRRKLTESVAERLLAEIKRAGLQPGTRMPSERKLQEGLGVSRSTVREALHGLAMLGVVEIRHGEGVFVAAGAATAGAADIIASALSRADARVLLEARRPAEAELVRLAAARRTSAELAKLRSVLASQQRLVQRGRPALPRAALFHVLLLEAGHNEVLASFASSCRLILEERGPKLDQVEGYQDWELKDHQGLYEAVRDQDSGLAAERMRAHLDTVAAFYDRLGWPR
jgi:GntR family transcriptional regulator, transcriptional repressor for pyruvate dehydrogenase complex